MPWIVFVFVLSSVLWTVEVCVRFVREKELSLLVIVLVTLETSVCEIKSPENQLVCFFQGS